jgi:gliding motility-associated-like protein
MFIINLLKRKATFVAFLLLLTTEFVFAQADYCTNILGGSVSINCDIVIESINSVTLDTILKQKVRYSQVYNTEIDDSVNCVCGIAAGNAYTLFTSDSVFLYDNLLGLKDITFMDVYVIPPYYLTNQQLSGCYLPPPYCHLFYNLYIEGLKPLNISPIPSTFTYYNLRLFGGRTPNVRNINYDLWPTLNLITRIWLIVAKAAVENCNSTIVYNNYTNYIFCKDSDLVFDCSGYDPDGDSLVYELCDTYYWNYDTSGLYDIFSYTFGTPGPFVAIPYRAGYSLANLIGGAYPLAIDPHSGIITGHADTAGAFTINVCVTEYGTGGVFKSKSNREMTFFIEYCLPPYIANTPSISVCDGYQVDFQNLSTGAVAVFDSIYHWDFGVSGTNIDTFLGFETIYTYPDTGTYTVQLIAGLGELCPDTSYATIKVYPELQANFNTINSCVGVAVSFYSTAIDSFSSLSAWQWSFGDGNYSNVINPTHTYIAAGIYPISLVVTNSLGCTDTFLNTLEIENPQFANAGLDVEACLNDTITLTGSGGGTYNWSGISTTPNQASTDVVATSSISYTLTTDGLNGCAEDTDIVTITIDTSFVIDAGDDQSIMQGSTVTLMSSTFASTYQWLPLGYYTSTISVSPITTTTYTLIGTNAKGCIDTDYVRVEVAEPFILIANAFSPDGDNLNDELIPIYNGIEQLISYKIFNRWGEKVFESNDLNQGWNGKYNGILQPLGTYVFSIEGRSYSGISVLKNGNVTLVK